MIRSMTGYGRAEMAGSRLSLSVECKSLNHRHLDIALKLPRALSALELDARRIIQAAVQRGRIEVSVSVAPVEGAPSTNLVVNMPQARAYVDVARRVGDHLKIGGAVGLAWALRPPRVTSSAAPAPPSHEGSLAVLPPRVG